MKLLGNMPYSNKLLALKEIQRVTEHHNKRLEEIKGSINKNLIKPPLRSIKSKKEQLIEEKFDDIEKGNQFLLKKITNIMQRGQNQQQQQQLQLQQQQQQIIQQQKKFQRSQTSQNLSEHNKKSLNQEVRKQQLLKIMIENQDMMKKISGAKSSYRVEKLANDRRVTEKYISQISEFPCKQSNNPLITKTYVQNQYQEQSNKELERVKLRSSTPNKLLPLYGSSQSIKILHRSSKKLGLSMYLAEIRIQENMLFITLEDVEDGQNKYILSFTEKEGLKMIKEEFKSDFNQVIEKIRMYDRNKNIYFKRPQMKDIMFQKYDEYTLLQSQNVQPNQSVQSNSTNNSGAKVKKLVLDQNKIYKVSYSDVPIGQQQYLKQKEIPKQISFNENQQQIINELDEDQLSAQQNEENQEQDIEQDFNPNEVEQQQNINKKPKSQLNEQQENQITDSQENHRSKQHEENNINVQEENQNNNLKSEQEQMKLDDAKPQEKSIPQNQKKDKVNPEEKVLELKVDTKIIEQEKNDKDNRKNIQNNDNFSAIKEEMKESNAIINEDIQKSQQIEDKVNPLILEVPNESELQDSQLQQQKQANKAEQMKQEAVLQQSNLQQ